MKTCDHKSVGVIVTDPQYRFLLLTRAKPPVGRAPIAGHVDEHGGFVLAGIAEAEEEAGLIIAKMELVAEGHLPNVCRRPPSHPTHDGHDWMIYHAHVGSPSVRFSEDETRGGDWYTKDELQDLTRRTAEWATGQLSDADYVADPGLEPVWVTWMHRLGHVGLFSHALDAVEAKYREPEQISAGTTIGIASWQDVQVPNS